MLKPVENKKTTKNTVIRIIGTILLIAVIILHLIRGEFQDFYDAALPWVTIGVAVAVVLSVSCGREDGICEQQNPGTEKKS